MDFLLSSKRLYCPREKSNIEDEAEHYEFTQTRFRPISTDEWKVDGGVAASGWEKQLIPRRVNKVDNKANFADSRDTARGGAGRRARESYGIYMRKVAMSALSLYILKQLKYSRPLCSFPPHRGFGRLTSFAQSLRTRKRACGHANACKREFWFLSEVLFGWFTFGRTDSGQRTVRLVIFPLQFCISKNVLVNV